MELALPCNSEGPEFSKVTKGLIYAYVLPIGKENDNPLLYTRIYEV